MNFKVMTPAVFLFFSMTSHNALAAVEGGYGKINFTGSIVEAACSVNPNSDNQEVHLGQVSSSVLAKKGTSQPSKFEIILENCSLVDNGEDETRAMVAPKVKVTFGGSEAVEGDNTWFALGAGSASGAGIIISDASGKPIPVNGSSDARELITGNNTLSFAAYLQGLGNTVTTGQFQSVVDFTLSYE